MNKIRIGLIFGGPSPEHNISIKSAISIIANFNFIKYKLIPVYLDKGMSWHHISITNQIINYDRKKIDVWIRRSIYKVNNSISNYAIRPISHDKICYLVDIFFPIIHGGVGEDGTLQGFLKLLNIPYIGCNVLSSSVAMDKEFAKILLGRSGIFVAPYIVIKYYQYIDTSQRYYFLRLIKNKFSFPIFIKPSKCGSSIGVSKVNHYKGIIEAIERAFRYSDKILIEQGIIGKEIEVSILENIDSYERPIVSLPGEIITNNHFYSYNYKYLSEDSVKFKIPTTLENNLVKKIRSKASEIFKILECNYLARIDFFLENNTNNIYFNEINTVPGFTEISLYPKLLSLSGIEYKQLLDMLINLSLKKHIFLKSKNPNQHLCCNIE